LSGSHYQATGCAGGHDLEERGVRKRNKNPVENRVKEMEEKT